MSTDIPLIRRTEIFAPHYNNKFFFTNFYQHFSKTVCNKNNNQELFVNKNNNQELFVREIQQSQTIKRI